MASSLVPAWDTRTGEQRLVPEHWFDHEDLSTNLSRTDPGIPRRAPDGVNQVSRPDDRDYATSEEIAAAEAATGELKGKDLDQALTDAGLSKSGGADDKRARLVEHQAELERTAAADHQAAVETAALQAIAAAGDPTDSTTGDNTDTAPSADQ